MRISIITAVYNGSRTIEQTIQSVLNQSHQDTEYIIIDGGSTDGTQDIIKRYEDKIAYWVSEPDKGIYDAMNKGILMATGDVIALLNSDDWYEPGTLEKVNCYFEAENIDMLDGEINRIYGDLCVNYYKPFQNTLTDEIHVRMIYNHPALFVMKKVYDEIGLFNLDYKIAADYEWILRAHNLGFQIKVVPDIFTNFRMGGASSRTECIEETRRVSLSLLNGHEEYISQIEEQYKKSLRRARVKEQLFCAVEKDPESIRRLLAIYPEYYIWGTGFDGIECYQMFWTLGMKIRGFIDNHPKTEQLDGIPVYRPDHIEKNTGICIATSKYEREVVEQLKNMGRDNYICFSYLKEEILNISSSI